MMEARNLNLGIDFDGVITDPTDLKVEWIKANCGIELKPEQTAKHIAVPIIGKDTYKAMIKQCYAGDWALKNKIRPEAIEAMARLIVAGHKAYIITSRFDVELEKALRLIERHSVPYSAVYNTSEQPKDAICQKLEINMFLDDSQSKLNELRCLPRIRLVFFNVIGEKVEQGIEEVKSWEEFLLMVERMSHESP